MWERIIFFHLWIHFDASASDDFWKHWSKEEIDHIYTPFEEQGVYRNHCVGLSEAIFFPSYFLQTTWWNSIKIYMKILYQEEMCISQRSYNCMLFTELWPFYLLSYGVGQGAVLGIISSSVIVLFCIVIKIFTKITIYCKFLCTNVWGLVMVASEICVLFLGWPSIRYHSAMLIIKNRTLTQGLFCLISSPDQPREVVEEHSPWVQVVASLTLAGSYRRL